MNTCSSVRLVLHVETEHCAQVRHVHLRSADAKTARLRRNFGRESSAATGSFAGRNELKLSRPFDHDARAAVENNLRQTRFEPQPARLQRRSQSRSFITLIPLRIHDTVQHRDGFARRALAFARMVTNRSTHHPVASKAMQAANASTQFAFRVRTRC